MLVFGWQGVSWCFPEIAHTSVNRISDGNIRYYEYENDRFEYLSQYTSADPQRGFAILPKRGVNVSRSGWYSNNVLI